MSRFTLGSARRTRAPGPGAPPITRFRRSELARLALVPTVPPSLTGSRTTGVHERLPPPDALPEPPADAIEDIHPSEVELIATLLELGALSHHPSALYARDHEVRDRTPHLFRHALQLARERGPYASTASIEGALEALRIIHGDARTLRRSVGHARELLAGLRTQTRRDPYR